MLFATGVLEPKKLAGENGYWVFPNDNKPVNEGCEIYCNCRVHIIHAVEVDMLINISCKGLVAYLIGKDEEERVENAVK
jgi:hypothetical protein